MQLTLGPCAMNDDQRRRVETNVMNTERYDRSMQTLILDHTTSTDRINPSLKAHTTKKKKQTP